MKDIPIISLTYEDFTKYSYLGEYAIIWIDAKKCRDSKSFPTILPRKQKKLNAYNYKALLRIILMFSANFNFERFTEGEFVRELNWLIDCNTKCILVDLEQNAHWLSFNFNVLSSEA